MNGLNQRTCAQCLLNIVLRPSPRWGRSRIFQFVATNGCKRDTVRGGAVATGVATPLDGRWMFSSHGRAASRGTTMPDSRWHGVSGRGASEGVAAEAPPRHKPATPLQKLVQHSAFLRTQMSAPRDAGVPDTQFHPLRDLPSPYLFGMVINSGPSHKCHRRKLCRGVDKLTRPHGRA